MADFERLNPAIILNRVPKNGHAKSEDFNDLNEQVLHDFALIFDTLNNKVLPILDGLGAPGTYSDLDIVSHGLDGTVFILDKDWTDTSDPYYWNSSKTRPNTLTEGLDQVITDLDTLYAGLNEVKARLGTSDTSTATSNPATLAELETKVNSLNSLVFQINNSQTSATSLSGVETAITNQTINPTLHVVDADVETSAGIQATKISGVDFWTSDFDYSLVDPDSDPYSISQSVQRVVRWVEQEIGDDFVSWSGSNVGGPTLRDHIASVGNGVVSSGNPHGLDIQDLSDGNNLLSKPQLIASFDVRPSGNQDYHGGYFPVVGSFTVTYVAATSAIPVSGINFTVYRRTSGGSISGVHSFALGAGAPPTTSSQSLTSPVLSLGDTLFISGISGSSLDCRVAVYGAPA